MATLNLASILDDSAAAYPERTALVLGDTRLSYAQLNGAASQVANLLVERGIKPGDKVALSCPNLPYFSIVYFGILKAGATVVPLNVLLKGREVAYHLNDSQAKAVFAFQGTPDLAIGAECFEGFNGAEGCEHFFMITADPTAASPIEGTETLGQGMAGKSPVFETVATDEDDTAVILYTSGTTGQPKGAELRHSNMFSNQATSQELFGFDAERPETGLCVLPLFHSFGQTAIHNATIATGGTLVLLPRFEQNAALGLMVKEKVTLFGGVPTMYVGLLAAAAENPDAAAHVKDTLRAAVAGGAALPVAVHQQVEKVFGVTVLEGYGLSETSPVASFSPYGEPVRPGSIGVPIKDVSMKLIDPETGADLPDDPDTVGEIAIKGPNVMKGYYNRPEATAEAIDADGWFRSGDLAKKDADGWFYIVDRSKDMIIRGGFNVYPRELEEVLLTHPAIALAAVIGVPHDTHGEEIKAVVVLKPGAEADAEEIKAWMKEEVAAYKYPRMVEIVPALPMTATGKILKREIPR
ncbi:long-chain-fatty-acid--CoA ligase [Nocardioides jejuensis]|uniref:Long-chain fatty acid--CoA ligase n=1 Tax=Nocardioides jejuensis TaxID=2502782 RepID=A0A4R1BXU0_9ACTN|nr:long-chain fatty acid--CoA ligase [Nocardioides jejuensis]TCJ22874.1 long-chain fatty acid--CoA ligase [Nocardioides jejuensis]